MGNYTGAESEMPVVSQETQKAIDLKVQQILKEQYDRAIKLINDNKKLHIKISEDLLKKEEIDREEFDAYFA